MIIFSRTLLCELETELQKISFDYDNPISMSDKSIEIVVKYLQNLKKYILEIHVLNVIRKLGKIDIIITKKNAMNIADNGVKITKKEKRN